MKRILIALASLTLLTATVSAGLITATGSTATNGQIVLLSATGVNIKTVSLTDTSGGANRVYLYDLSSVTTETNRVFASWISTTSYTSNTITTNVDLLMGQTNYTTNNFIYTVPSTNAAATNRGRVIWQFTIPASSAVTWTPSPGAYSSLGLVLHTLTNVDYIIQYDNLR